jgi:hypothetical protein
MDEARVAKNIFENVMEPSFNVAELRFSLI